MHRYEIVLLTDNSVRFQCETTPGDTNAAAAIEHYSMAAGSTFRIISEGFFCGHQACICGHQACIYVFFAYMEATLIN